MYRLILLFTLSSSFLGCFSDVKNLEFTENFFDASSPKNPVNENFEGEVIKILDIQNFLFQGHCNLEVLFKIDEDIHEGMNSLSQTQLYSMYFEFEEEEENWVLSGDIITSQNNFLNTTKFGAYSPGISDFTDVQVGAQLKLLTAGDTENFTLNVIFVLRDRVNANFMNRVEIVKQRIVIPCN